jgi:uncharacterized protein
MSKLSSAIMVSVLSLASAALAGPLYAQTTISGSAAAESKSDVGAGTLTQSHVKELFFEAAREGRDDLLAGLLQSGTVQLDERNPQGYTALILAAYNGHPGTVDFLISRGADACATDTKGNTSLMGVAFKGETAIAARLIAAHCDVNAVNKAGQTALMMAALFGRTEVVKLLLAHGADVSLRDGAGNTATSLAQQQASAAMLDLLKSAPRGG